MVRDRWIECPITDVFLPNGIKIGPFGSQLKKETLIPYGQYKVYGQENVYEKDFSIGDRYLEKEHFDKLSSCEIVPGDFVMSTMGTIGKCAIVPIGINKGIMDSHLVRLRFDSKKILPEYLLHLFSDDFTYLKQQTSRLSVGGIMDGLSVGIVSSLEVSFPESKDEQLKIISVLSEMDELINVLEKEIEKKKNIKFEVLQKLIVGEERLNGYTENWVSINMAKKSKLKARIGWQGLTTAEYLDSGYSYLVTGTDFEDGHINWDECHYVTADRYFQDPNIQLTNGDVLITKDGTIGKVALVDGLNKPATLNSGVFVVRPINNAYSARFLYYVLESRVFRDFLDMLSAGSTIVHLYQKDLVNFSFMAPATLDEQEAIASIIYDMDCEIREFEDKLHKYKKIKQGMMNDLLTGKNRLV
ncbi:MAG: restriction endonuclease subunit S [Eubacterium sp.]|nr:restriction endonuclease subunit S [Eubacterium sp.]